MSEHTPGPWTVVRTYKRAGLRIDAGSEQVTICDYTDHELSDADARLIVAAPDLLAACQDAYNQLSCACGEDAICDCAVAQVGAAIDKATGRNAG